jgi:hypothetical protein
MGSKGAGSRWWHEPCDKLMESCDHCHLPLAVLTLFIDGRPEETVLTPQGYNVYGSWHAPPGELWCESCAKGASDNG